MFKLLTKFWGKKNIELRPFFLTKTEIKKYQDLTIWWDNGGIIEKIYSRSSERFLYRLKTDWKGSLKNPPKRTTQILYMQKVRNKRK